MYTCSGFENLRAKSNDVIGRGQNFKMAENGSPEVSLSRKPSPSSDTSILVSTM